MNSSEMVMSSAEGKAKKVVSRFCKVGSRKDILIKYVKCYLTASEISCLIFEYYLIKSFVNYLQGL